MCESCLIGSNKCGSCGETSLEGTLIDNKEKMIKCRIKGCGLQFHKQCVEKMELKEISPVFICNAHFCWYCKEKFDKKS